MFEKLFCRLHRMTPAMIRAQHWANEMLRRESRGSGDVENAMRRLGTRYGINWRIFWALKYRPPVDILHAVYTKLETAYLSELNRQQRLLEHEIFLTENTTGDNHPAVRAAKALASKKGGSARASATATEGTDGNPGTATAVATTNGGKGPP